MRGIGIIASRPALSQVLVCILALALWSGLGLATDSAGQETTQTELSPRVLRQVAFNIPFNVNGSRKPVEVQLYVSTDAGVTWKFYARRLPSAGHFPFRAGGDGQFWFASRTVDQSRGAPDTSGLRPELHVIVDTREPRFEFEAIAGADGQVRTSWRIVDQTLDPGTLKIVYQSQIGRPWQTVPIDLKQSTATEQEFSGAAAWRAETSGQTLNVRAEVSDRAGNKAVVSQRLFLPKVVNRANWPRNDSPPPDPFADVRDPGDRNARWPSSPVADPAGGRANAPLPTVDRSKPGLHQASRPQASRAFNGDRPDPSATAPQPTQRVTEPDRSNGGRPVLASDPLPPGERPRMTQATRFQLDYQIDAVGPSGIKKIELWGTRDGGRNWSLWSVDHDQQSPIDVDVKAEGVFGFRVVIVGNNGLAGPAPRNGDLADLWVGVDMTPPTARLTSVIYGEGNRAGQLDIRWIADDARLMDRPITLLFSDQPSGPWTTIASGLDNTGQYFWSIDPRVPKRIYLRIEARDQAGNLGEHQLAEPIAIAGLIPKARIRGVRPALKTSRGPYRIPAVR